MPKFFTVCYGEPTTFNGRRCMTEESVESVQERVLKIKEVIGGDKALVLHSGMGASKQCADIVADGLHAHRFADKVLINPSSRGGPISTFLEALEKKAKKTNVFVVITSPDNHDFVETFITSGLTKRATLVDLVGDIEAEDDAFSEENDEVYEDEDL